MDEQKLIHNRGVIPVPDHTYVYKNQASQYDALISSQPNLLHIIEDILPVHDLDIIDLGAGSGRFTTVLAPRAKSIVAVDSSAEMLEINANKLKAMGLSNWDIRVADMRQIPAADQCADLIIAGWSICYLGSSNVPNNEQNIAKVIQEMERVIRPGGTIIIFETMGTGYETPHPPDFLMQYYALLENEYGFHYKWIRVDYQFQDIEEAEELTQFFFGEECSNRVVNEKLMNLPECAGVWWKKG